MKIKTRQIARWLHWNVLDKLPNDAAKYPCWKVWQVVAMAKSITIGLMIGRTWRAEWAWAYRVYVAQGKGISDKSLMAAARGQ